MNGSRPSRPGRFAAVLAVLALLLLTTALVCLCAGDEFVPVGRVFEALSGSDTASRAYDMVVRLRLPRLVMACAVGGALALAGAVLQGMFRNPLVEPYTLGISGGAALGVCLAIVLRLPDMVGVSAMPLAGFAGAGAAVGVVYGLGAKKGIMRLHGVLLTGVMVSFICSAMVMLIVSLARVQDVHSVIFWFMGSLDRPEGGLIALSACAAVGGLVVGFFFSRDLNALALGEDEAAHLGVNIERTKRVLFLLAAILTGVCVSVAGVIGFVGLVVPHVLRIFIGPDHRLLLPASFLTGAAFLSLCDKLSDILLESAPLPVGVITGIVGGTVFIIALRKRQVTL